MKTFSDALVAVAVRLVSRSTVRLSVEGRAHVPKHGPVLLVSNHVSYLDGFLIASCVGPVVRFLAWKPYYDHPLLNWGYRLAKAIPVSSDAGAAAAAIRSARAALQQGEILCVFAEGSINRNSDLLPFQRGLEAMVRGLEVPIVPVRLDASQARFVRRPVRISFGVALPSSSKAAQVREAVARLR
jgi:acyl-[acyl-carrier-protein]-phospholipid O-acyltransferase/long-chain-fatty-acid--[acyl-carrier-protein] ligase